MWQGRGYCNKGCGFRTRNFVPEACLEKLEPMGLPTGPETNNTIALIHTPKIPAGDEAKSCIFLVEVPTCTRNTQTRLY